MSACQCAKRDPLSKGDIVTTNYRGMARDAIWILESEMRRGFDLQGTAYRECSVVMKEGWVMGNVNC